MHSQEDFDSKQVFHLVICWALMPIFLYFAGQGQFWFISGHSEGTLSLVYGSLAAASSTGRNIVVAVVIFFVVFVILLTKLSSVLHGFFNNYIFLVLSFLAIISCVWAQFPVISIEHSMCLLFNVLFVFYFQERFSREQRLKILYLLGWICLISSLAASLFVPGFGVESWTHGWRGIYGGKNQCAEITAILIPSAYYVSANGLTKKFFCCTYVFLSIFLVVMTRSATGKILLLCLFICFMALDLLKKMKAKDKLFTFFLIVITAAPVVLAMSIYSSKIALFLDKDPTLTGRTDIWKSAMSSIMKRPVLGYGYMSFWNGYKGESANASLDNAWAITSAHNGLLEIWLTLGAVGLSITAFSFINAIKNFLVCFSNKDTFYVRWCICVIVLVAIYNTSEMVMMAPNHLGWILYVLACVGLSQEVKRIRMEYNHD